MPEEAGSSELSDRFASQLQRDQSFDYRLVLVKRKYQSFVRQQIPRRAMIVGPVSLDTRGNQRCLSRANPVAGVSTQRHAASPPRALRVHGFVSPLLIKARS